MNVYLFNRIIDLICLGQGFIPSDLCIKSRNAEVVYCRQLIMYFARKNNVGTLSFISGKFYMDHSTVCYSMKVIMNWFDTDRDKRAAILSYSQKIKEWNKVEIIENKQDEIFMENDFTT